MKKIVITFMLVLFSTFLFSQNDTISKDTINKYPYFPDRPGFSTNARLVGLHQTDYEVSFGYNTNYGPNTNMFYNTNLVRFGMYEHLEFRFGLDFGSLSYLDSLGKPAQINGVKGVSFGVKIPIVKDLKYFPDVAILGQIYFAGLGKPEFISPDHSPQVLLLLQKGIGNFTLLGNVGMFYDGYTPYANGVYSICVCYNITPKLGTFIESYSFFSGRTSPLYFGDLGFNYFITDNLEMDISCGNKYFVNFTGGNIVEVVNPFFINCGFAWRIPHK